MTAEPIKPSGARTSRPVSEYASSFEDLTARARIREAALQHFAAVGYEAATIRDVAATARVSAGLIRHHYGSKEGLQRACDAYVVEVLERANAQLLLNPGGAAASQRELKRFQRYIARAILDRSPFVEPLFDQMVASSEQWIERADRGRSDTSRVDRRIRAALVSAMATGIPLLHEQLSRVLGIDIFEPEGDRLITLALLDIYSHRLLDEHDVAAAAAGFDEERT